MSTPDVEKVSLSFDPVPGACTKAKSKSMQAGTPAVPGEAVSIYEALTLLRRRVTYYLLEKRKKRKVETVGGGAAIDLLPTNTRQHIHR
jgi:hypothetical protein